MIDGIENATREELVVMANNLATKVVDMQTRKYAVALKAIAITALLALIVGIAVVFAFIAALIAWDIPTAKDMLIAALADLYILILLERSFLK